ncbi:hypothetical protein SPRG_08329 [Saprolegnia parasitica CBS 223.65]|uniref:EF-hand domain-containing protein n=1 Tax=Saprolegnia parasitica (strain CBS 223.65) TaxID=695850 RepID=A0A067C6Z4_SAPPC|nr:hypothetical protein SPRG_08329 [Saprolegnia parasitica CBS 223.65]KDO26253.1 hypothetical protein SPRG_08329 [Saprolegnia parasitica CBS 223.65]|eukprot:XP_012202962.1 hypothetical protein SPRG_08329 [Saprolegnia parasitica CBS 223.65]
MAFAAALHSAYEARAAHLDSDDVAGIRSLFTYYDTNMDGNVSSVQALRMFQLLGLTVNEDHVNELELLSFAEFLAIVDCQYKAARSLDEGSHEWHLLDHFRRDHVTPHQLAYFLKSCDMTISDPHLERFQDLYANADEASAAYRCLEKDGCLKLLRDFHALETDHDAFLHERAT